MKKIVISSLILVVASASFAQSKMGDMKGMDMAKKPVADAQAAYEANGTIKKIDAQTGNVVISHGPVSSLNWPPMTMSFKVKDKNLLGKLAVDKKVDFGFAKEGDDFVITTIK
jgi:Cu(I)/Ag(I) efflux system protein CusF